LVDGVIFKEQHLRYTAYRDQLVMFNENRNDLFTVDKEIVSSFEYEKEGKMIRFVRLPFETFFSKTSFFRILYEGNQKLLARHFVREVKVSPYKDKNNVLRDTEFRSEIDYYLYNGKGEYKKLQLKRKSLLSISPENKKEVKRLLRANRLDFLSEFSLIQAIQLLEENGYIK
jgi:hypothetical protein